MTQAASEPGPSSSAAAAEAPAEEAAEEEKGLSAFQASLLRLPAHHRDYETWHGLCFGSLLPACIANQGAVHAEPNGGNGADMDHYSWTQTLRDVVITVPVPPGTKGRDCDVRSATACHLMLPGLRIALLHKHCMSLGRVSGNTSMSRWIAFQHQAMPGCCNALSGLDCAA